MTPSVTVPTLLVASYIVGALPFGLLIARLVAGIDVRDHGSGNIGATNVYRVVGKPAGVGVFTLDVLKGFCPPAVAATLHIGSWWTVAAGIAAILGHNFSPFIGFKGGKGISTSLGVLFGIAWKVGVTAWALWGLVLAVSGYVSVGSIVAAISLAPLAILLYPGNNAALAFCLFAGMFAIYKHRANIGRLRNGTEHRFRGQTAETDLSSPE